ELLLQLAVRYDNKQFLPTVPDVREFLLMIGVEPEYMKDRKDAFRVLLRSLTALSLERLQQISNASRHSGPSQLGPLSDAIAAVGDRLPRGREAQAGTQGREPGWEDARVGGHKAESVD